MGQRSQIYIRVKGELVVANYYQWNYAERMISRARAIIEWIDEYRKNDWLDFFKKDGCSINNSSITKLRRICDINFDMRDVAISCDIFKEYEELGNESPFKDYVFLEQDNNDGKLFVDVTESGIKYCFTDYNCKKTMGGEKYMAWERGKDWKQTNQYFTKNDLKTCLSNIRFIKSHAKLMTKDELEEFINKKYQWGGINNDT